MKTSAKETTATRTIQITYDRSMCCEPFDDPRFGRVEGLCLFIRFGQTFTLGHDDQGVPAGAADLNKQLQIAYTPLAGLQATGLPATDWGVDGYAVLVAEAPGVVHDIDITRAEFTALLAREGNRFDSDPSLQSSAYSLSVAPDVTARDLALTDALPVLRSVVHGLEPTSCPNPGHNTRRDDDGRLLVPAGFDFGTGPTWLDSWIKHYEGYGDRKYLQQWSDEEWLIAAECFVQLLTPDGPKSPGTGQLCPCAPVPPWFWDIAGPHLQLDPDSPNPSIGQCYGDEGIDWLALTAEDPQRWQIEFPWENVPTFEQVRSIQKLAHGLGAPSGLWITFDPATPNAITGIGKGLAIKWDSGDQAAAHAHEIAAAFAGTSTYLASSDEDREQLWLWC